MQQKIIQTHTSSQNTYKHDGKKKIKQKEN
jgi:hypothetical protein